MIREFLYVDADKVRSLLAQIDGGVAEESRSTDKTLKKLSLGIKNVMAHDRDWSGEESVQRSLADAVFPMLEEALESSQLLVDLSEPLQVAPSWTSDEFRATHPGGSFVRITAPSRLFDARYAARTFAGLASSLNGFLTMFPQYVTAPAKTPKGAVRPSVKARPEALDPEVYLEAQIMEYPSNELLGIVSPAYLRAMTQLARGLFRPGLHLALTPAGPDGPSVSVRLQEGKRFLDSEPDILFARYGLEPSQWTVVGTIGSYAPNPDDLNLDFSDISDADGNVSRSKVAQNINELLGAVGRSGFADLPQYPGFTIVPFAVYRPILTAEEARESHGLQEPGDR